MEYKEAIEVIMQAIGWVSFILLTPFLYFFSIALVNFIFNKLFPIKKVIVRHIHDGVVISEQEVDLSSDLPLIYQLEKLQKNRKQP